MKKLRITETDFMLADRSTNTRIQISAQLSQIQGISTFIRWTFK